MWAVPADLGRWTRRAFLSSSLAGWAFSGQEKGAVLPPAWRRYPDPATELEVTRLTDPAWASYLPAYYNRAVSRHSDFLMFSSNSTGTMQAYQMDLHSGAARQLTAAEHLDRATLLLLPDERSFCYCDGPALYHAHLANLRGREIYRVPGGLTRCPGASVSSDGAFAVLGESRGATSRLRLIGLQKGAARTILEVPWQLADPQPRPRRAQVLYRQGDQALWLVNTDGSHHRKLPLADGRIGPARWSPDGRTVLYLHFPDDPAQLHAIRECVPDSNTDTLVARTSQYAHFGCNRNTSVFVGASQNRAAPYILILLRVTRRELPVCEHGASDPARVAPIFSPDSQQIFFQSDREGHSALYRIRVDRLVAKTESDSE
jgi:oligogalacturonide lyase